MQYYEGLFIIDINYATNNPDGVVDLVRDLITKATKNDVNIESIEKWGERKFAYPINKQKTGMYVLSYFYCDPAKVNNIYRQVNITEPIYRCMIVRYQKGKKRSTDEVV